MYLGMPVFICHYIRLLYVYYIDRLCSLFWLLMTYTSPMNMFIVSEDGRLPACLPAQSDQSGSVPSHR